MEIHTFLRLVRWKNLTLIVVLQSLIYLKLQAACMNSGEICSLQPGGFLLILATTLFVTAAGYVINDLEDVEIDLVNRPGSVIIGSVIPRASGWRIYGLLLLMGTFSALGLVLFFSQLVYVWGYLLATALLYSYSKWWKKSFLAGNLLVSLMCAVAIFVCLIPDWENAVLASGQPGLRLIFIALMWFAGLLTFYREIVKDMEDLKGDRTALARTMPVQLGIARSRNIALLIGSLVVTSLVVWLFLTAHQAPLLKSMGVVFIALMMAHNLNYLRKARTKAHLHFISQYIKIIMVFGIIAFLLY